MDTQPLLQEIDAQIAKLQHARTVLAAIDSASPRKGRGRPPKKSAPTTDAPQKRRTLSPVARARIAAAQRKRWAEKKKAAKKTS